jgi:hypothetical protein
MILWVEALAAAVVCQNLRQLAFSKLYGGTRIGDDE